MTLTLRRSNPEGGAQPYATYTLKTVFITDVDHAGSSDEVPSESVRMIYGTAILQMSNTTDIKGGKVQHAGLEPDPEPRGTTVSAS